MLSRFRAVLIVPMMLFPLLVTAGPDPAAEVSALVRSQIVQLDGGAVEGVAELSRFYSLRGDAPAWDEPAGLERLAAALETLREDGLEPADYEVALLRTLAGENGLGERVFRDVLATRALLRALGDLAYGRLDPARVEPLWHAPAVPVLTPDRVALVALAKERAVRVPEDLSLVALGDPTRPTTTDIDFSGFSIPREEMGEQAVEVLTGLIEGHEKTQRLLPCELVAGSTLAASPADSRTERKS